MSTTSLLAPPRLSLAALLHATDLAADAVLRGHYSELLPTTGLPTGSRWFTRIHRAAQLEIWLISWVPGHPTELHDHGDSLGALTVLSGSLDEFYWDTGKLKSRRLRAGDRAGFPRGWVHDVTFAPAPPTYTGPTLSVHAYSPPLAEMSYYLVGADNTLAHRRTEITAESEPNR